MNRSNQIKISRILLGLVFILLAAGCGSGTSTRGPKPDDPGSWTIEIDPTHQICTQDSDCGLAFVDCSWCDCGVPINIKYEKYYQERFETECLDYSGPVCEMYCPPSTLICTAKQCEVKPE